MTHQTLDKDIEALYRDTISQRTKALADLLGMSEVDMMLLVMETGKHTHIGPFTVVDTVLTFHLCLEQWAKRSRPS